MTETLLHAYTPLLLWTGLGLLIFRFLPQAFPQLLGRGLYWVGVPVQLLALARRTNLSERAGLAPVMTMAALGLGFGIAFLTWFGLKRLTFLSLQPQTTEAGDREGLFNQNSSLSPLLNSSLQGSFILAAVLGNTGFVGLGIVPNLIDATYLNWVVFYSITHNVVGTYGFGVLVASYFGHSGREKHWWILGRDVLSVPPLWAFIIGYLTQSVRLPESIESGLQASVDVVIACAFVLIGIRLSQLQGWKSFQTAIIPALLRVVVIPAFVGVGATLLGVSGDNRLAFVLMSGVPTAFAGLILAEEYNLDRELVASSIVLSTVFLLFLMPLWIAIFD